MFDYKKYSVQEYNEILKNWFNGIVPNSTDIFKYNIKSVTKNDNTLLIIFFNNCWLKVDNKGWWCEFYSDETRDIISNRHFYQSHRTSESLGLGHVAYTARPAKGITYKNMVVCGADISRNLNRVNVNVRRQFHFNVEHFKKYKEYQFNTDCGLFFYEKVNNKNEVLRTTARVSINKDTYGILIERSKDRNDVVIELNKNFEKEIRMKMKFKDCSIDNIFNKYIMFEFDLNADQKSFDIIENVRTQLKSHISNTYTRTKEEGSNVGLLSQLLKRIEVIESDEYQIQRKP